jgi:hypothetical protein
MALIPSKSGRWASALLLILALSGPGRGAQDPEKRSWLQRFRAPFTDLHRTEEQRAAYRARINEDGLSTGDEETDNLVLAVCGFLAVAVFLISCYIRPRDEDGPGPPGAGAPL